jgi:alpha-glucosidase
MVKFVWWKHGVIYQIYPRSFQDTDGNGVGDLKGISERLDYLEWLGVDAIWISPIYPSPMADFGYDVSDYCSIDPLFGSLEDFDRLVDAAHARKIKVILDFVPNHTVIRGFSKAAHRASIRSATGTSGATARPMDRRPITGCRNLADRPGRAKRGPASTTCTAFCPSSPI